MKGQCKKRVALSVSDKQTQRTEQNQQQQQQHAQQTQTQKPQGTQRGNVEDAQVASFLDMLRWVADLQQR